MHFERNFPSLSLNNITTACPVNIRNRLFEEVLPTFSPLKSIYSNACFRDTEKALLHEIIFGINDAKEGKYRIVKAVESNEFSDGIFNISN